MNDKNLIEEARKHALEVLYGCITPHGFRASALKEGYPQIWSRDSMIMSLGAVTTGDSQLQEAIRASLITMREHQSSRGLIQLNVNPDNSYVSSENAGALDCNLWFILGHFLYFEISEDLEFLQSHWMNISKALEWLDYQDMNECGLLEVPEAGNWMDLFAVRYNVLYDNVLYYAATLAFEEMNKCVCMEADPRQEIINADGIHERINLLMWIDRSWVAREFAEHLEKLKTIRLEWFMLYHNVGSISSRPYYLPWVAFREYGDWFDSLGNLLAILTGMADRHRTDQILRFMQQVGMAEPYPTKAIYPPIYPGDNNWREYYRSRTLNLPHQYHNGGIWPMVGGFHVASLVKYGWHSDALNLLKMLAEVNQKGIKENWEFNEWMHGETGHPMGYSKQGWSAAMYLYAYHAVYAEKLPLFDKLITAKPNPAKAREVNTIHKQAGGGPV